MNTYKVLKNFRDTQNNRSLHKVDEEVKLTKERGESLSKQGYVELIETPKEPGADEKTAADATTKEEKFVKPKAGK